MRIEILISNLLFGMTILTGALALAHLIGDVLISGRNINARVRKALRVLIACFSIAVCLSIFLHFSNLGTGQQFFSVLRSDQSAFLPSPRLVVRDQYDAEKKNEIDANFIDREKLRVLTEKIPDEILSKTNDEALKKQFVPLAKIAPLFTVEEKLSDDCDSWLRLLSEYGVLVKENSSFADAKIFLGCSSAPSKHPQWEQIEREQKKNVLLVGPVGDAPHALFSKIFPESTFSSNQFEEEYSVALTGADLLVAALPPGLRFFLGREWLTRPGTVMSGPGSISVVDGRWQKITGPSTVMAKKTLDMRRVLLDVSTRTVIWQVEILLRPLLEAFTFTHIDLVECSSRKCNFTVTISIGEDRYKSTHIS